MGKYNDRVLKKIYKRVIGAMSGLSEIDVEIHTNASPHFNSITQKVVMPNAIPYAENDEEDFEFGRGIVVHEGSHVLFCPDQTKQLEACKTNDELKDFANWFNVLADANNEYKVCEVFPHLKQPLADKTEKLFAKRPEFLKSDNPFTQILMRIDKVSKLNPEFPEEYPDKLQNFVERWVTILNKEKICEQTGTELLKSTQRIHKAWTKLKGQQKLNPNQQQMSQLLKDLSDAIQNGDGQGEADINDKIDKLSQQKTWFKDEIDKRLVRDAPKGAGKFANVDLKELQKQIKNTKDENIEQMSGLKGMPPPNDDVITIDAKDLPTHIGINSDTYKEDIWKHAPFDTAQSYKQGKNINRVLKKEVKLEQEFQKNHRSGRIDFEEVRNQVSRAGQIYKTNIYTRDFDYSRGGQWVISVLCDLSVSMRGLMSQTKQAFATVAYALDGLPNVKWELCGFSCGRTGTIQVMSKKFKDNRVKIDNIKYLTPFGGTPTGEAMTESYRRLMAFPNHKKIMLVITDGEPGDIEMVQDIGKRAEANLVNVIGIGIGKGWDEETKDLFPTTYVIKDMGNFDKKLTRMILTALHRQRDGKKLVKRVWER